MATYQRKLVHKQFNSPIGLYSDNNVKATLDRELKVLSNGTVGIDFDDSTKPTNLANSAVLRMLEEEEQEKRQRQSGVKRVIWPPEQSPSRSSSQPPRLQPSPARDDPHYYQDSQSQYPQSYKQSSPSQQHQHQRSLQHQKSPDPYYSHAQPQHQHQHLPQQQQIPQHFQQQYQEQSNQQAYRPSQQQPHYQQHQEFEHASHDDSYYQPQSHQQSEPVYQRQQTSRSRNTPSRTFPNPDPSFLNINTPEHLRACQEQQIRAKSPCTAAFAGGVAQYNQLSPNYQTSSGHLSPAHPSSGHPSPAHPTSGHLSPNHPSTGYSSPRPNPLSIHQDTHYHQIQLSNQPSSNYPYDSSSYADEYSAETSTIRKSFSPNRHMSSSNPNPSIESIQGWSHVKSPTRQPPYIQNYQNHQQSPYGGQSYTGQYQQAIPHQQQSFDEQHYQQHKQQLADQQQYQQPEQQQYQQPQSYYRQPSPGVITLRDKAPFNQESSPVYASQPAAASFGGGTNMRGDQKWPPEEYKKQSEVENEARRTLAHGPAFRPRRIQKDYREFFGQHALNPTYPSYRAPPGTQHHAGR